MPKESKTTRELIEEVHAKAGVKRTNIRPLKEVFEGKKDYKDIEVPPNIGEFKDRAKAEINGMLAFFIEKIWIKTLENIRKFPPGLARESGIPLSAPEVTAGLYAKHNSEDVADFLMERSRSFLEEQFLEWHKNREEKWKTGLGWVDDDTDGSDFEDRAYNRYVQLLMYTEKSPSQQIVSGIVTALNTTWGTVKVLPKVYEHQFSTTISINQFEKLLRNSLPLIYTLAGQHLAMLSMAEDVYAATGLKNFDQTQFYFRTDGDELFLELKPEAVSKMKPRKVYTTRTGCPALYATGPSHRNVIAEMFDWEIDLVKKYYLPALQKEQNS